MLIAMIDITGFVGARLAWLVISLGFSKRHLGRKPGLFGFR
jgi:hypothetical protein